MFEEYFVTKVVQESDRIKSFYFKKKNKEALPPFIPGNYVALRVDSSNGPGTTIRNYTLSDSPLKDHYRITVKEELRGSVSSHLHQHIQPGHCIWVSAPTGNFHLNLSAPETPVYLISAGVGITPMLSMLEHIVLTQPGKKVNFIHSSRNRQALPMLERLQALTATSVHLSLSIHLSEINAESADEKDIHFRGRLTESDLRELISIRHGSDFYVCGPEGFMDFIRQNLQDAGVKKEQIFYEFFNPKEAPDNDAVISPASSPRVIFKKSLKEAYWDGSKNNLLELAEFIGLSPEFSCRMGTCSTCETKILSGEIEYDPEPFMESSPGNVFICCCKPVTDIELDL